MKKNNFFILLLILISSVLSLNAQGNENKPIGDIALLFGIKGLGDFGLHSPMAYEVEVPKENFIIKYNFVGLGIKYYLSKNLSIVPSLIFGINSEKHPSIIGGNTDEEIDATALGFTVGLRNDIVKYKSILSYIGVMSGFIYGSGSYKPARPNNPPTGTQLEKTISSSNFLLAGNIGFEYFVFERISLGAEYILAVELISKTNEIKRQNQSSDKIETSETSIGIGIIGITLSAYF